MQDQDIAVVLGVSVITLGIVFIVTLLRLITIQQENFALKLLVSQLNEKCRRLSEEHDAD